MRSLLKIKKQQGLGIPKPTELEMGVGENALLYLKQFFFFPFLTHGNCFLGVELHIHKFCSLAQTKNTFSLRIFILKELNNIHRLHKSTYFEIAEIVNNISVGSVLHLKRECCNEFDFQMTIKLSLSLSLNSTQLITFLCIYYSLLLQIFESDLSFLKDRFFQHTSFCCCCWGKEFLLIN